MTTYRKDSMYRNTGLRENKYLDVMVNPIVNTSNYDTHAIAITNKYDQRPDLLAYELYGNAKLWWVFALFNQDVLVDPIIDFTAGTEIIVPTKFT